MARFKNVSGEPLDFRLGGAAGPRQQVPVGGEIDVPDKIAYCIPRSGLPLERVDTPAAAASPAASAAPTGPHAAHPSGPLGAKAVLGPEAPPWSAEARRWYDRAQELAGKAMEAHQRAKDLEGALDAAHERAENHHQRAEEASRRAEAAEAEVQRLDGNLAEAGSFLSALREKLGIPPSESALARVEQLLHAEAETTRLRAELESATAPTPGPGPTAGLAAGGAEAAPVASPAGPAGPTGAATPKRR
jgi:hypothetical protein